MERFADGVVKYRVFILLVATAVTVGFSTALPKLYPDDDVMQFLPADNPEVKLFRRVNERFGGLDVAIVGLESEDLFSETRLQQIRKLTRYIGEVEGVLDVLSFTEVPNPVPGHLGLTVEPLVGQVPSNPEEIDLVITDIGMPGMGGHKFLLELIKLNSSVKVIIASGYSINGQVKKTMEAGAKGYVGKPYQIVDLLEKVRSTLDGE